MIAIIDYGMGNLRSVQKGFEKVGLPALVTADPRVVLEAESSVWFGVTMRGDNEEIRVGRGSNVQENCVLHTDMGYPLDIGQGVTIGQAGYTLSAVMH